MIDNSQRAQNRRRKMELALLEKHGRYDGGKIPVGVLITPTNNSTDDSNKTRLDRVDVLYEDGTNGTFEIVEPGFLARLP